MEWARRLRIQNELEAADSFKWETLLKLAKEIEAEPDKVERQIILDMISEELGGQAHEFVMRILRKDGVEV